MNILTNQTLEIENRPPRKLKTSFKINNATNERHS